MTAEERRFLRAQARWSLAQIAYQNMSGAYVYAIADELQAAAAEVIEAAGALMATPEVSP